MAFLRTIDGKERAEKHERSDSVEIEPSEEDAHIIQSVHQAAHVSQKVKNRVDLPLLNHHLVVHLKAG